MATRRPVPAPPRIDPLVWSEVRDADPVSISPQQRHDGQRFAHAELADRDLSGAEFVECEFLSPDLHEAQLRGARIIESRIERGTSAVLRAARTHWRAVEVERSRFGAIEMYEAELRGVRFADSKLSFLNLRSADLRDVSFEGCVIEELDLSQARAERIAFSGCTVGMITLDGSRLEDVDLRGLELRGVSGLDSLRGTVMDRGQAIALAGLFAAHLGVTLVG